MCIRDSSCTMSDGVEEEPESLAELELDWLGETTNLQVSSGTLAQHRVTCAR